MHGIRCGSCILGYQTVKRRVLNAILMALALASAFGIGMWFMYFVMWTDVFVKFMEMAEKVFK